MSNLVRALVVVGALIIIILGNPILTSHLAQLIVIIKTPAVLEVPIHDSSVGSCTHI